LLSAASMGAVLAQAPKVTVPVPMAFGKVDIADLEMKSCEFEKDANAEVLFDKAEVYFDQDFNINLERHMRVKIFNEHGKEQANVRIEFYGGNRAENIFGVQAETINEVNGKPEITRIDKSQIFTQNIDKYRSAITFSLPNVKPGCIIEYKYKKLCYHIDSWFFQNEIPTRYSEVSTSIPEFFYYRTQMRSYEPYYKDVRSSTARILGAGENSLNYQENIEVRAMANVRSLPDEPFMSSRLDNLQSISFQLESIRPVTGLIRTGVDSWEKVGGALADDEDFGGQLKRKLNNEEEIINKAKTLKTDAEKMAYLFNKVRDDMKWNGSDEWYTEDGTYKAWEKKTGNATEINLILYHLLKKSGVDAYPMVVSTKEHGRVNASYPYLRQFNRGVVYVPVDSTKRYILDASGKYNCYNEIPSTLLNSSGLYIDKDKKTYNMFFIKKMDPARQVVMINAEIKPGGKMEGNAEIYNFSYSRMNTIEKYKTDGEKKYTDFLRNNDNNLKITSLKFEGMDVDTLPLKQNVAFNLDLAGTDENYIFIKPNLFTPLKSNEFLNENRYSDIDFGYRNNYAISGTYKIPPGYKSDALPKNIMMTTPDKQISFRRLVAEQDGIIQVRYSVDYKKTIFFKEDYADLREFYKKMYEMLNEQIVLKKS
jgi:hypothetical protein